VPVRWNTIHWTSWIIKHADEIQWIRTTKPGTTTYLVSITKKNSCTAKTAGKNCAKGAIRKEIKQVLSAIQILLFDLKKFLHKLLLTKQNHAQPKGERKIS